ncbi:MAG: hypothetical protein ABGW81_10695 [Paracoccaceae bacterium]
MTSPVLETSRLKLRKPLPEDFPAFEAFCSRDRSKWVGGPADRRDAWEDFTSNLGHWVIRGYGYFHVEMKELATPLDVLVYAVQLIAQKPKWRFHCTKIGSKAWALHAKLHRQFVIMVIQTWNCHRSLSTSTQTMYVLSRLPKEWVLDSIQMHHYGRNTKTCWYSASPHRRASNDTRSNQGR